MRQATEECLICKERPATKLNSHIIPKFFSKGIFDGIKPRFGILMDTSGKTKKVQDIIKEDHLFCLECERALSVIETYCALHFNRINNEKNFNICKLIKRGEFKYLECKYLDKKIFNLFIYSIVWRVSISLNKTFLNFNLGYQNEEELRIILKEYLKPKMKDLTEKLIDLKELPKHSHVIIKPNKVLRPPNSLLSVVSGNNYTHILNLVDYMVIYLTERNKLEAELKEIDNNNLETLVRIGITNSDMWKKYYSDLMNKFII